MLEENTAFTENKFTWTNALLVSLSSLERAKSVAPRFVLLPTENNWDV
jgi:hypothetical protein